MQEKITRHILKHIALDLEYKDDLLYIPLEAEFKLINAYPRKFIEYQEQRMPIATSMYEHLFDVGIEKVTISARDICLFLADQLSKPISVNTLTCIAQGKHENQKVISGLNKIRKFLTEDLYLEACEKQVLIVLLQYLSGAYCGRRDSLVCEELVLAHGNPVVHKPKAVKEAKSKTIDTEWKYVEGYMRTEDGVDHDFNWHPIRHLINAWSPNNKVVTLKDIGIRSEDAVLRIKGDKGTEVLELNTPHKVNKFMESLLG